MFPPAGGNGAWGLHGLHPGLINHLSSSDGQALIQALQMLCQVRIPHGSSPMWDCEAEALGYVGGYDHMIMSVHGDCMGTPLYADHRNTFPVSTGCVFERHDIPRFVHVHEV